VSQQIKDGESLALVLRLMPNMINENHDQHNPDTERRIEVDQSNYSVIVNERVIVKWLNVPLPEPHPGVRILAHLDEVGYREAPKLLSVETRNGLVYALINEYLVGAVDGWDWCVNDLQSELFGIIEPRFLQTAAQLGEMCARLHVSLATPSALIRSPITQIPISFERSRCQGVFDQAVNSATGSAAIILQKYEGDICRLLSALDDIGDVTAIAVHGDLHVGQFLRTDQDLYITDFDGDPIGSLETCLLPRPAVVDVASLMQSIDHVGRVVIRREPTKRTTIESMLSQACDAMLATYCQTLRNAGKIDLFDERLLWTLRVAQELHEIAYASTLLPEWIYVPEQSLPALFEQGVG